VLAFNPPSQTTNLRQQYKFAMDVLCVCYCVDVEKHAGPCRGSYWSQLKPCCSKAACSTLPASQVEMPQKLPLLLLHSNFVQLAAGCPSHMRQGLAAAQAWATAQRYPGTLVLTYLVGSQGQLLQRDQARNTFRNVGNPASWTLRCEGLPRQCFVCRPLYPGMRSI
jgi:hypothetical protein